jgi:hypothetical protein
MIESFRQQQPLSSVNPQCCRGVAIRKSLRDQQGVTTTSASLPIGVIIL